jgi:hypothetical protein
MNYEETLKRACKHFNHKEMYKQAKLYSKSGVGLFDDDDLSLLQHKDIVYLAMKGKLN